MTRKKLGESLIEEGLIDALQLSQALGEQRNWGGPLGALLVKKGFVHPSDLARILARQIGVEWVSLRGRDIPEPVYSTINAVTAKKHKAIPIEVKDKVLVMAMSNPTDLKAVDGLAFATGKTIKPVLASEAEILMSIARHYDKEIVDESELDKAFGRAKIDHESHEMIAQHEKLHATETLMSVTSQGLKLDALLAVLVRKGVITEREMFLELEEMERRKGQ